MVALAAGIDADDELVTLDADLTASQGDLFTIGTTEIVAFRQYFAPYRFPRQINRRKVFIERGVRETPKVAHLTGAVIAAFSDLTDGGGGGGVTVTGADGTGPVGPYAALTAPSVADGTTFAIVKPVIIAPENPGVIGPGNLWLEFQDDGNSYQLWVRDPDDTTWLQASAGLSTDSQDRQLGNWKSDFGGVHGIEIQPASARIRLRAFSGDENDYQQLTLTATTLALPAAVLTLMNLPTADPHAAGVVFSDGVPDVDTPKTLKISGG